MTTNEKAVGAGTSTAQENYTPDNNSLNIEQRPDVIPLNIAGIPEDLKAVPRWLLWRYTWSSGKWAKVPYRAADGRAASSTTAADWCSYDGAVLAYSLGDFDGLGFALGDGYHGVDVDDCRTGDVWSPLAQEVLSAVPGYAETSPSGQGLKVITRTNLDRAHVDHAKGLELYTAGRYFAVTGARLNGHDGLPAEPVDLSSFVVRHFGASRGSVATDRFDIPKPPCNVTPEQIEAALSACLRAGRLEGYGEWLQVGMALHHQFSGGADGLDLWDQFSSQAAGYTGFEALESRWRGFDSSRGSGVTFATVLDWAKEAAPPSGNIVDLDALDRALPALPQDWVDALIPAKVVTLLGGHGGTGKSALALLIGAHIACGIPFAGRAVRPGKVLFISCEDDEGRLLHRLVQIRSNLSLNTATLKANLQLIDLTQEDPTLYQEDAHTGHTTPRYDWLARQIAEFAADVVIVDNVSDAFAANENSRPMVRAFIRSMSKLIQGRGGAVLLLAHIDKAAARGGSNGESYSGSTAWNNSVRSRLAVTGPDFTLSHEKANYSEKAPPIPLHWVGAIPVPRHGGDAFSVAEDAAVKHIQVLRLISEYFQRGSFMSPKGGAKTQVHIILSKDPACSIPKGELSKIVLALERSGDIEREEYSTSDRKPGHRWRLTAAGGDRIAPCAPCAPCDIAQTF